jgi:metallophosphoesterase superfamily enzyme
MSDLIEALAGHPACSVVRRADYDAFLAGHPHALLFFTGDVATRPEGLDVAIVARELLRQYDGRVALGLVDRRDEGALMAKAGVVVLPAIAFVAGGKPVEVVARMRDWAVYAQAAERMFAGGGDTAT